MPAQRPGIGHLVKVMRLKNYFTLVKHAETQKSLSDCRGFSKGSDTVEPFGGVVSWWTLQWGPWALITRKMLRIDRRPQELDPVHHHAHMKTVYVLLFFVYLDIAGI